MSALIISTHLYEKRPLKKPKLGPPDVYPQDPKQKEDELTSINVKQGYSSGIVVQDEYGSARNSNITPNRFGEYFSAILSKKHELNTFPDTSRKKPQINKDSTLYVTPKTKNYVDSWFKDLATNAKSLSHLARKVPVFNKKEEIFTTLYEFNVPMFKAEWFLKISSAHQIAMSESNNKSKKRQMPDPSQEWTTFLCKFLKEHYLKIMESVNQNNANSMNPIQNSLHLQQTPANIEELLKQWNYFIQIARYLYEDGLLDRHEFLSWLLELYEKIKSAEDPMMNLIVPLLVQYVDEYTQSEFLSRRLSYQCAKKINQLVVEFNVDLNSSFDSDKENLTASSSSLNNNGNSNGHTSSTNNDKAAQNSNNNSPNKSSSNQLNSSTSNLLINNLFNGTTLSTCFKEIISCKKHRTILFSLSTIIQVITLDCPTALVWLNFVPLNAELSSKGHANVYGSPLDYLPCEPSNLPIPSSDNEYLRKQLRDAERLIRYRSKMSENKWFFQSFDCINSPKSVGSVVNRLLYVLDCLDKHLFDKVSSSNSLDSLYNKIFITSSSSQSQHSASHLFNTHNNFDNTESGDSSTSGDSRGKSLAEIVEEDLPIVRLLCEWAVTTKRLGEYRARVVAKLLERRQSEVTAEKETISTESSSSMNITSNSDPVVKVEQDDNQDKANGTTSATVATTSIPKPQNSENMNIFIYQNVLFDFIDLYAPVYEDTTFGLYCAFGSSGSNVPNSSLENKQAFNNLILLFSELIRYEVFSHDFYMCTLISMGHFTNPPNLSHLNTNNSNQSTKSNHEDNLLTGLVPSLSNMDSNISNGGLIGSTIHKSTSSSSLPMFDPLSTNNSAMNNNEQSGSNWLSMSNDNIDEDLDEDLDKILQHIKAGQQSLNDQTDILLPDAMESDKEDETNGPSSTNNNNVTSHTSLSDLPGVNKNSEPTEQVNSFSRHLLYTLHFPLPQDEFFVHECNQRHILLYGVGKAKDEARHSVKKVTKEILKLFNRKSSMDISDGGKVKKHVIKEGFNFENAIAKFQNLSIFDQQVVTNSCAASVLEMLNGVMVGNANHLPLIESIAFLFDLMEIALNVNGLIEFIVQILKELVEVETQLQQKCSMLARPYCTSIGLYIVGVLYRYHNYVIASNEDILAMFDGLWKLVRHVGTPSDCSSAERCIFYYIHDLYTSCSHILKKYHENINPVISKIKSMSNTQNEPTSNTISTSCNMMEYLKNPKLKVDTNHIRQLNDNANDRYSLVFNVICCISEATDMDQLNEMSVLCAELTATCSQLSNEWFGAFKTLCNSTKVKNEYSSLLSQINIGDRTIYDNLAVFTSILVARRCFSLEEFIMHVCLPSLLTPIHDLSEEAERSARLSCHLMLYLFKYYDSPLAASNSAMNSSFASSSRYSLTSPSPLGLPVVAPTASTGGQKPPFVIKYACDRYLLGGALNSLRIELIVTVLKAIFVLGTQHERRTCDTKPFEDILKQEDDFSEMGLLGQISKSKIDSFDKPSLSDFSKHVLRKICLQDWVHDRCLRGFMVNPEILNKLMLDKRISHKDAQYLLNMICYHKQPPYVTDKSDSKQIISRIFQNLDEWSIRVSWLQLYLIYEQLSASLQTGSTSEVGAWLDTLARAVVEYFQNLSQSEPILDYKQLTLFTSKSSTAKSNNHLNFGNSNNSNKPNNERIWLVGSLVAKLPQPLQSKILRVTASVFDSSNWIIFSQPQSSSISSKSKNVQGLKNSIILNPSGITITNFTSSLLSYQPFVSLLLMCLNSKEDDKSSILNSIYLQVSQCINEKLSDDIRSKHLVQEGIQLRFSLVGAMFEVIQGSNSLTNDWSILLLQLISYTIVDPHINYENFSTALDMLSTLMHNTQMSILPDQREETKKQYQNLIKKLKKEVNVERIGLGVRMAKQLLPIAKIQAEVITCEPMGSLVDTKGNKIAGFDSIDKKQGLQVADKQKLSPWDLLEGHKSPAPLSWTWFGGIRIERKPMRLEENFYLLARHNHNIRKPTSYFIEPPPLPPEDEIVPPPPPPTLINQNSIQSLNAFNGNSASIGPNNSGVPPNCQVPSSPHLGNMPPQPPSFNSPNMMHQIQQQPNHNNMSANNFHSPHMHHMSGMPVGNGMPHPISQGPPPPPVSIHGPNSLSQQPHILSGPINEHQMNQPPHHMMVNSHMNANNPSIMPIDNREIMMDTIPPNSTVSAMHGGPPMPPGPMNTMRPPAPGHLAPVPPPMNPVGIATNTRAKKPKVPRRRRQPKNAAANGTPPTGQLTPPIRMANSFDNYQQPPNQISQAPPPGPGATSWQYQQGQVPNQQAPQQQPNMIGQQSANAGQPFYQQPGPPGPTQSGPSMMPPQAQQTRFADHTMQNNNSKVRLRAMLNTRHPNTNQFNMAPQVVSSAAGGGVANSVNSGPMNNNQPNSSMMPNNVYQARQQMQMIQPRPQMRPQVAAPQPPNQPIGAMSNQNSAIFQQQQQPQPMNQSVPAGPMHHQHISQQQQPNFVGQQNIPFNNNGMQNVDNPNMQQIPNSGGGYPSQPPGQAPNMMMRPQMQINQQSNQAQFMAQRSQQQYNNVAINQQQSMSQSSFGHQPQPSQQQQQQPPQQHAPNQQQMMGPNQHWSQPSQMNAPARAPMTQLQRQLSSNQGPQGQQPPGAGSGHPPYHQVPY